MRIVQKSPLLSTSFVFEAENLICVRKDWHGVQRLEVPYGSIRMEPGSGLEQNAALFACAVALFFWGLVQAAHALLHADPYGPLFLLAAPACLAAHALIRAEVVYLPSDAGEISLLRNGRYDTLMEEINKRRKKQLLEWYGDIDFGNDPEEEIRKFHWLHSEHLISEDQLRRTIAIIRDAETVDGEEYSDPTPPHQ